MQGKMSTHARKQTRDDTADHQEGKIGEDASRFSDEVSNAKLCQIVGDGSHTASEKQKMSHQQKIDQPDCQKA